MLQSGGQNQKWPTSGPGGYIAPTNQWVPGGLEGGTKSQVEHKWAKWLYNPCQSVGALWFRAGDKIRSGPQVGPVPT